MIIKILLDECLPKKLKYRIEELDVFVTSDRNLSFQQSIESSKIQVVLLKTSINIYEDLLPLVKKLPSVIKAHKPGQFAEIK